MAHAEGRFRLHRHHHAPHPQRGREHRGLHTCCSEQDIEDAAEVAYAMDIPYEVLDFTADFREKIIEKFIRVYEAGGTPNPCIDCNRYMKFDHLLRWAEAHGWIMWSRAITPGWSRTRPPAAGC